MYTWAYVQTFDRLNEKLTQDIVLKPRHGLEHTVGTGKHSLLDFFYLLKAGYILIWKNCRGSVIVPSLHSKHTSIKYPQQIADFNLKKYA